MLTAFHHGGTDMKVIKRPEKNRRVKQSVFDIKNYLLVFLGILLSTLLCASVVFFVLPLDPRIATISQVKIIGTALLISLGYTVGVVIYRGVTIEKPTRRILDATERIGKGDFRMRIINEHHRRKNEYDVIIDDINKMAEELGTIETLRTDFVANVSHEIKTPLAVIRNYSTLLEEDNISDAERKEYAKAITDASKNLSELISNILKLHKLENQQIFPEFTRINIGQSLTDSIIFYENMWDEHNIDLQTDIPDDIFIPADRELLSIVWHNLISNTLKFTPNGGTVAITATDSKDYISVTFTDSGCGISKDALPHIFEKFYQGDRSHSTQGNGLGLALVKRIVDIHGGSVSAESKTGRGSKFTVTLPKTISN